MSAHRNSVIEALAAYSVKPKEAIQDSDLLVEDLEMDSLDHIEAVMAIEETLKVEIPDDAMEQFKTVGDLLAHVEKHRKI